MMTRGFDDAVDAPVGATVVDGAGATAGSSAELRPATTPPVNATKATTTIAVATAQIPRLRSRCMATF